MKLVNIAFFLALAIVFWSCGDDALKGTLTISITDSPIDADNVQSVNLVITNFEARRGSDWKSLRSFEQPVGINLLAYSGGKSFALIDQDIDPGKFTELRFSLNLADRNSSLVRNPQCNVAFADGTSKPIYFFDGGTADLIVTQELVVASRRHTDFTFDIDVRKSLSLDDHGNFVFKPVVRIIETTTAGHIQATVANFNSTDRVVAFAYKAGLFSSTETAAPAAGEVRFKNAITSSRISKGKFGLGFLEAGSYDLVLVRFTETGEFLTVLGRQNGVPVTAGETMQLDLDLTKLSG